MLDGQLTAAGYKDFRNNLHPEMDSLERKKVALLTFEDDYQKYLDKDIPLLRDIGKHWLAAGLREQQRLVG